MLKLLFTLILALLIGMWLSSASLFGSTVWSDVSRLLGL